MVKPSTEFYASGSSRSRLQSNCKPCYCIACKVRRERAIAADPERVKADTRTRWLKRYRITPEVYAGMLKAQGGVCAISKNYCPTGEVLVVDHYDLPDGTPVVRGLLTRRVNAALGLLDHDPAILRAAADYLDKHGYAH